MANPRFSALVIGFFFGFVVPYMIFATLGYTVASASIAEAGVLPGWLNVIGLIVGFAGPVIAGYLAAKIARVQPLLHGFIVGVLGSIMFAFLGPLLVAALFAIFVLIPGSVAGAWLWKRRGNGAP